MISEGSCDTEDLGNDAENSAKFTWILPTSHKIFFFK